MNSSSRQAWVISCLLGLAVLAVYWPALGCGFLYYDDPDYVALNTHVQQGFDWPGIRWAFTTGYASNWHPVTWLSHILDFQLYGSHPAGHHLTSVLLHAANSVLLFLLLRRLTGAPWRSAFVAALFALHPLRVESVAWVSERKDVLSAFFGLLAVWAYVRYVEEFKAQTSKFKLFYAAALVLFALGLMAKPILVTLPFVLLLLDYWPLGRFPLGRRLILEKVPFMVLTIGSCVVTYLVQQRGGAVLSLAKLPLAARLENMPVAYARYLGKTFWPGGLAVFYPFPQHWPVLEVAGATVLLLLVTAGVVWQGRHRPFLPVGWFWFLGMLVPVIGLVQVGEQSCADRNTYLALIGVLIMVSWGMGDLARRPGQRVAAVCAGGLAVMACAALTPRQVRYWKTTETLFSHALAVTSNNYLAHYNLGCALTYEGNLPAALQCFEEAVRENPRYWLAENDLGFLLLQQGRTAEAIGHFQQVIASQPLFAKAHFNLGRAFLTNQQPDDALRCLRRAVALDPKEADFGFSLGEALLDRGQAGEAQGCFEKALEARPDFAEAQYKLANTLVQLGRPAEAVAHYWRALRLRPVFAPAASHLAWLLATAPDPALRDGPKAVELAREANEDTHGKSPLILGALAAACAEAGRFPEAIAAAQQARGLALAQTNRALADDLEAQLRQYQDGVPFRAAPGQPGDFEP
ncbi:MAG: tetratricopeptide repeat protein [Verrucomicrobiota bacterium]